MAPAGIDQGEQSRTEVVAWDGPVRLTHWGLVGLIGFTWYAAEFDMMEWHRRSGYVMLGLLAFRVFWGFVGSSTARFGNFVKGPGKVGQYVRELGRGSPADSIGHNPLGALSVLALLLVLLGQVLTGLFAVDVDGIESGPLSDRVSFDLGRALARWHHLCFTALQAVVVLHIAAILFYFVYKHDNLVRPMITGKRFATGPGATRGRRMALIGSVALAALLAWFVSKGFRS